MDTGTGLNSPWRERGKKDKEREKDKLVVSPTELSRIDCL